MKKLVNPLSTGGAPIYGTETFSEILTQEVWDSMEAMFESLTPSAYHASVTTDNMVLSGGEITDVGGGLFNVAAGIAYFKSAGGIIARFPALASVNPTVSTIYINLEAPVTEQKTFFDATPKDYAITHSAVVAITATTDYVTGFADTGGDTFFPTLQWVLDSMTADTELAMGSTFKVVYDIGAWDMSIGTSGPLVIPVAASGTAPYVISKETIVSVEVLIRADSAAVQPNYVSLTKSHSSGVEPSYFIVTENPGDDGFEIVLASVDGGYFETEFPTNYDSLARSRGKVIATFERT